MRRQLRLGSLILDSGLFLLLAMGCGHDVAVNQGGSATGGATSTGTGNSSGGAKTTTSIEEIPVGGNDGTDTDTTPSTGECPVGSREDVIWSSPYTAARDPGVDELLKSMSLEDKIKQFIGIENPPDRSGDVYNDIERSVEADGGNGKTVRGWRYRDAGRGVNLDAGQDNRRSQDKDYATNFPAASIRSASWDVDLEYRAGQAMGDETMASKNNMLLAPCMNIIRHPYWGRTQETYGEDMYHTGVMASAYTVGLQHHVAACAKHYAANNIENGRAMQNAEMDEQTLREVYGRHFEMVIQDGGVACVMASYNSINGVKSTQNKHLLTTVLRDPLEKGGMGYRGLVLSDWWAMPGDQNTPETSQAQERALEAFKAGMDIEVPWSLNYSQLGSLVSSGKISQAEINEAAARVLEQKFRFKSVYGDANTGDGWGLNSPPKTKLVGDSIENEESLKLAEEIETKSAVLLSNGTGDAPVLPIKDDVKSIAVLGLEVTVTVSDQTSLPVTGNKLNFATTINAGDRGSSRVNPDPATSIGPFDGIKSIAATHDVTEVTTGTSAADGEGADFIVVVVGLTAGDEGEEYALVSGNDRTTLDLPNGQADFVNEVLDLGKPTAIFIESGSIVNVPWLSHSNKNQATFWAGYPGQWGGNAFGKLLFGDVNPSGRLPLAWPTQQQLDKSIPFRDGEGFTTRMGYFFGYREYDRRKAAGEDVELEFPFGHGLSYTSFKYANLKLKDECDSVSKNGFVNLTVDLSNTGEVAGQEVIQMYVQGPKPASGIKGQRAVKELKGFKKVALDAGKGGRVTLQLSINDLRHWEGGADGKWVIDEGEYTIFVGPNASDEALTQQVKIKVHG